MSAAKIRRSFFAVVFSVRFRRPTQKMPANGSAIASVRTTTLSERGMAAVVVRVRVTSESPLPDSTWVGLKVQVVNAGRREQLKLTLLGNVPVVGETSTL